MEGIWRSQRSNEGYKQPVKGSKMSLRGLDGQVVISGRPSNESRLLEGPWNDVEDQWRRMEGHLGDFW